MSQLHAVPMVAVVVKAGSNGGMQSAQVVGAPPVASAVQTVSPATVQSETTAAASKAVISTKGQKKGSPPLTSRERRAKQIAERYRVAATAEVVAKAEVSHTKAVNKVRRSRKAEGWFLTRRTRRQQAQTFRNEFLAFTTLPGMLDEDAVVDQVLKFHPFYELDGVGENTEVPTSRASRRLPKRLAATIAHQTAALRYVEAQA